MKKIISLVISVLFITQLSGLQDVMAQVDDSFVLISGIVRDSQQRQPMSYASVSVSGTNVATVSNLDGHYSLKVPKELMPAEIEFRYIGYQTTSAKVEGPVRNLNITMQVSPLQLAEVKVRPNNAASIVGQAFENLRQNYDTDPNMMVGFYRESIKKNSSYVSIVEAILDIYKAAYFSPLGDQAKVYRGRKGTDPARLDTVLFKFQGGVTSSLLLDIPKYSDIIFGEDPMDGAYYYYLLEPEMVDGRTQYVVGFNQSSMISDILYRGKLYIDMQSFAISHAEFNLNVEGRPESEKFFIKHKPLGFLLTPLNTQYIIDYRMADNGKWYYNYSRTQVEFSTKWKRKLFRSNYTIQSEMVMTDRYQENLTRFPTTDRIRSTDVIAERIEDFEDETFWGEYNVIEPDQSVDQAIRRLSRVLRRRD